MHVSLPVNPEQQLLPDSDAYSDLELDPEQGLAAGCKRAAEYGVSPQLICVEYRPPKLQAAANTAAVSAEGRAEAEQEVKH
ncbi:MAG: hypothetical protein FRX49_08449 [Trebouxia sp. A1-2]|nr:MAG: hypothetical protein FRX49_08449 [Trebouxia sp. A1-2]